MSCQIPTILQVTWSHAAVTPVAPGQRSLICNCLPAPCTAPQGEESLLIEMSWLTDESPLVREGKRKSQVSLAKWTGRSATREGGSFICSLLLAPTLILPTGHQHIVLTEANRDPCLSFLWLYPWRQRYGGLPVLQVSLLEPPHY